MSTLTKNGRFPHSPIQPKAIQQQMARILAAPDFVNSRQLSAFLQFIVKETLAGREKEIKQYTVGVGALGRKSGFDPQTDPIVRITAGRLRQSLAHYYEGVGRQDPVVITIPKGRYVPVFQSPEAMGSALPSPAARAVSHQMMMPQGPSIVVLPFDCSLNEPEQLYLVNGLTGQLIVTFNRFPEYLLIGPLPREQGTAVNRDLRAVGEAYDARFVLSGSLRQQGQRFRLTVKLTDVETGGAIWADTFDNDGNLGDLFAFEDMAVNRITAVLGDNFGVIPRYLAKESVGRITEETAVYDAILRYYHYVTVYTDESHAAAFAALTKAVQIAPDYPFTLALLADMHYLEYHFFGADESVLAEVERLALRAMTIDPQCQHCRFIQSFTYYHEEQKELFVKKMEQAIALNPNNSHMLFEAGSYLIVVGEWEGGTAWLAKAKRINPHYPSWIHLATFLIAYLQGRYDEALADVKKVNMPQVYVVPMVRAAVLGQMGRVEEGKTAVSQLLALQPDFAQRGRELMRRLFFSNKNVEALADGLAKVGLLLE